MKINSIQPDISNYFKIVHTIAKPPKRLWYLGTLPSERIPTVAIIGTRTPTVYGKEVAYTISAQLAKYGVIVVSGLALGIDAIAHTATLQENGTTIAVMAGGLDAIYPRSNTHLARRILTSGGALISEYAAGETTYPANFIARNRIVAGISNAVLVIEASAKSGTMHTASFALEQGRTVMAVPGNITNPLSEGCNNLIKAGARPITRVQDVLDELGIANQQIALPLGNNTEEHIILQLLAKGERDGEEVQKKSGLAPALFSQTLTLLEVSGKIRPLGANKWTIK